ncbi:hypothetical protein P691DRAFT_635916, partial [Macrolepiota fuliginosa MF-IS2]
YHNGDNFPNHIAILRTLWQNANAMGAGIKDTSFRTIVLGSLPRSWDSIVSTLYRTTSSPQLVCSNQNCRQSGHTIEDCYWPGGGKQGQFPPNFGRQ